MYLAKVIEKYKNCNNKIIIIIVIIHAVLIDQPYLPEKYGLHYNITSQFSVNIDYI